MKKEEYTVTFVTGQEEIVYAFCESEAKILAQAQQILKGNDYTVKIISCRV